MQAQSIKKRFFAVTRERLRRTRFGLRPRQQDFIELLPLLFHMNDKHLPGYVSDNTPCGISDYRPTNSGIEAAQRIEKSFSAKKRALRSYDIFAIYLTGSSGTIAYSEKSDFDIWLCHNPALSEEQLAELHQKTMLVSQWADKLGLEVHFFIVNEERFRNYEHGVISEESSGSAQHHLLLEEFYRTGLLVAGRYPAWWLVPVEEEINYDDYIKKLLRDRVVSDGEFIDFGTIAHIPAEEFFGASLWQIFKGIDSPYKSVLKILLLEAYAHEYPSPDLLCQRYKQAIHEDKIDLNNIDPYIMVCNKVEEYLLQLAEPTRLELARRCFYFKTCIRLSESKNTFTQDDWRREKLASMVDTWGWDQANLLMLDSRSSWKIHRVLDERKILIDELMYSYQLLSRFAQTHASLALIDQRDMTVLGRKLYATFERKAGKIDIINHDISPNLIESKLSVHLISSTDHIESWVLYRGHINQQEALRNTPLRRASNLTDLLVWCHFNKLVDRSSIIVLHTDNDRLERRELRDILNALQQCFPRDCMHESRMADLERPSKLLSTALFINTAIDPVRLPSMHRTVVSNRNNPLSYSGFLENLVLSIQQVSVSSWNEVFVFKFQGIAGILDCLSQYIESALKSPGYIPGPVKAFSFTSAIDHTVSRRIEELFNNTTLLFCSPGASRAMRFVIGVENKYYLLQRRNEVIEHSRCGNIDELYGRLSTAQDEFVQVIFDEQTLADTPLKVIYNENKAGKVQLFYYRDKTNVDVYIIDEHGSLFKHRQQYFDTQVLLSHFDTFLYAVHNRMKLASELVISAKFESQVEYYEIIFSRSHGYSLNPVHFCPAQPRRPYLEVSVIIEPGENSQEQNYRVFCQGNEFSSLEYGRELFHTVAMHILRQRNSSDNYPVYITDVDITADITAENTARFNPTIRFLLFKSRIESQLNMACDHIREQNIVNNR